MAKLVTVISGSPRKNKNSDFIVDTMIKGLVENNDVEIKKFYLKDLKIGHCIACGYCEKTGRCFMKDDGQELHDLFDKSDGVILASPIYMDCLNSFVITMIDRLQALWSSKYILKKPSIDTNKLRYGALILVGGAPKGICRFEGALMPAGYFFKSINTVEKYRIMMENSDKVPASERNDIIEKAYEYGKNFFKGYDEEVERRKIELEAN
ncbi:MAG: flavodoxin family protein [Andreesenia angusta]|nr:flavodoxin family protein [Andreesenia angusta]